MEAGAFADGFPGEVELQEAYGVSRHTVREALRRIRDAGLLDSGRGRPTRVRSTRIEQPLGGLYSIYREVEARGLVQRSTVLAIGLTTDPTAADRLQLSPTHELFHLERLRFAADDVLAHDHVWLPAELGEPLLDADFSRAALYDELERRSGVRPAGGQERISAVVPTGALRRLLEVPRGQACLRIERVGCVGGRPVESRVSTVRGDRFSLTVSWSPRGYRVGSGAEHPTGGDRADG
ncbi:MAG: GntR family transcriptional regulator [Phycicoccus sp.]